MRGLVVAVALVVLLPFTPASSLEGALVPGVTSAQDGAGAAPEPRPAPLTDAEWGRLLDRLDGTWRLNLEKSTQFLPDGTATRPQTGGEHIYVKDAKRRGIGYKDATGESFQVLDGKPYPSQLMPQPTTVARWPIDEFTLENLVTRQGKPTSILMQFLAPDGQSKIIIGRSINEHGEQTPTAVSYFDKVPAGSSQD
jgi:hypothetical protein